jgi:cation:H+ antiporter
MTIVYFLLGLVFLIIGAEALVRGASRLAAYAGISPLVVGLTVVAFGTSSPELAVSIKAALSDQANIALGNVVGSNIFNVLFILGISAIIIPLVVAQTLVRVDVPLMIMVSILLLLFSLDGVLSRLDGMLFVSGLLAYISFLIYQSRRESQAVETEYVQAFGVKKEAGQAWLLNVGFIVCGLVLLVLGSRWLVESAVAFAQYMGVSELVVGLTIVAAGTSLPEVVTSIIAAVRGERDIAVGNVVGSNLFNILGVLGISSIVAPSGIAVSNGLLGLDIPLMIVVAFACLPIFFTGGVISRREGLVFLGYYIAYTAYLVMAASGHAALGFFSASLFYFAIPLTLITLLVLALHHLRRGSLSEQ